MIVLRGKTVSRTQSCQRAGNSTRTFQRGSRITVGSRSAAVSLKGCSTLVTGESPGTTEPVKWSDTARIRPICPPPTAGSPGVPFAWLDRKLSYWRHLGWRLLVTPNINDQVIDYNDQWDLYHPFHQLYRDTSDHFRRWTYGGLLVVSLRCRG